MQKPTLKNILLWASVVHIIAGESILAIILSVAVVQGWVLYAHWQIVSIVAIWSLLLARNILYLYRGYLYSVDGIRNHWIGYILFPVSAVFHQASSFAHATLEPLELQTEWSFSEVTWLAPDGKLFQLENGYCLFPDHRDFDVNLGYWITEHHGKVFTMRSSAPYVILSGVCMSLRLIYSALSLLIASAIKLLFFQNIPTKN